MVMVQEWRGWQRRGQTRNKFVRLLFSVRLTDASVAITHQWLPQTSSHQLRLRQPEGGSVVQKVSYRARKRRRRQI